MSPPQTGAPSSRSLFRHILQGAGLYSIAMFAQRIGGFVMLPIVTHGLSPADYGVSGVLEQINVVLSLLLGSGFSWSIGYFYFKADSDRARQSVVGTTVAGSGGLGVLVALVFWPLAGPISRLVFKSDIAADYLRLMLVGMPIGFALESLFAWVRVANRPAAYLWSSLLRLGLTMAGIMVFLAVLRLRIWGMLYGTLVAMSFTAIALTVYCFRTAGPRFDRSLLTGILRFSLPVGISAIGSFVVNFGDQLILPSYVSRADVGTYVLAYKIGMLIYAFVYSPFHVYWSAQVYVIMKREDAGIVFARLFTYLAGSLSFCAIGLLAFTVPLMRILPADYRTAGPVIPVIVLAYCLRATGEFVRLLFLAEGHPAYDAVTNWVGSVICLIGYFGLIPKWGIWGAAIATVVSFALIAFISFFWTYRLRPYRMELARLAKVGVATAAGIASLVFVPVSSMPAEIARAVASLAVFLILLVSLRFFTPGEMDVTRRALLQLRAGFSSAPQPPTTF
jgi:O-antigen/teichoic acid export membrane protein